MEVRLGFNESFFFSSHFSLSYPKNSRYPFQKSIMPFSLYFYQIWHLFFLLPFVLLLILLKVFFFNFILRHFNSYNLFIQFDPYSFDCFFFVFYPWFICFSISPLIILFYFFILVLIILITIFLSFSLFFYFFSLHFILFYFIIQFWFSFFLSFSFLIFFFNLVPNYFLPFSFYIRFGPYCFDCYLFCS